MHYFYLEVVKGIELGRRYRINDGAVSIGRGSSNTVVLHSGEKLVSAHHAIIYKSPDKLLLQDMQSTNGSFINEEKIQERELLPNDIIGFGKKGPRLKLIKSETELVTKIEKQTNAAEDTKSRTVGNDESTSTKFQTSSTVNDIARESKIKSSLFEQSILENPSLTAKIENRLLKNNLGADDMHSLMKNSDRLEKILDRGKLSSTQSSLLVSAYGAVKKTRKQWILIVSIVSLLSIIIILFLGIRMFQYRQILNRGLSLEDKLDFYERKIFQANNNPEINKKELAGLILELEETKKQLESVKEDLHDNDFEKFYEDETEKFIDDIMVRFGETDYHIPPKMTERVKYHISVYSGKLKQTISRYLKRKRIYFPMINKIFKQNNLPIELSYISMLESGFNPKALSHAGARGLWQFMPNTGRNFGLTINDEADERCAPEKSTYAAAEYFKDLIGMFGGKSSVMLAMAAYNAGEGRIMSALRKIDDPMRNRDFWYIYRMGYLAEETNEYIPRVLALMIIDEHPDIYGFGIDNKEELEDHSEDNFIELDFD